MSASRNYPLDQCALYRITSPDMLAARLSSLRNPVMTAELDRLAAQPNNHFIREQPKPNGGTRKIEEPKPRLQSIHGRIHDLLSRVELPDYVHSVRKGRSYITNARVHVGRHPLVKVDVEKFYPSVKRAAIFEFFQLQMQCAADVAGLLARLLTLDGHLPTGSKSSPILSYFVNRAMFDEMATFAESRGMKLTVYVDDMTLSGFRANNGTINAVRRIIARHGLRSHKLQQFDANRPKVVTGIVVTGDGIRLPNRRHQRIHEGYHQLHVASTDEEKLVVLNRLGSQVHEAAQIDPRYRPRAVQLDQLRRHLRSTSKAQSASITLSR